MCRKVIERGFDEVLTSFSLTDTLRLFMIFPGAVPCITLWAGRIRACYREKSSPYVWYSIYMRVKVEKSNRDVYKLGNTRNCRYD